MKTYRQLKKNLCKGSKNIARNWKNEMDATETMLEVTEVIKGEKETGKSAGI